MGNKKRVLFVGWDSADWKIMNPLMEEGGMDGIKSMMDGGVSGNLMTLEPQLSPMLWTSIATGKMAYHHGVKGFTEVDPVSGQVVPVSAASRQCKTVWEILGEKGLRSHVVSWFATQGEQDLDGKMVSNMFSHLKNVDPTQDPEDWPEPMPGTYWPEDLGETMNDLRVSPHEMDGEILQAFLPLGGKIDQTRDKRIHRLMEHMAEAYSVHSAATHLMETDPDWDFMAVYYRPIDEISHHFMHYHPPKMEGIPEGDFEIYQHVVNSTYRAHDMMLQRLIAMAGPDTTVILVSDHGFHSDHLRPKFTPRVPAGITVWHREQGVLLAKGPGIKETNTPVYGARLLDIAPTILHHFGLPIGDDMEGRVLTELFESSAPVQTIPTWEKEGERKQQRGSLTEEESQALLEQFVALGYIDEVSDDPSEAAAETNRENKWNLARACLYGNKNEMALPLLEDCFTAYPERSDYAQLLARTQFSLGLTAEAEETLEICLESFGNTVAAHLLQAQIALHTQQKEKAIEHIDLIKGQAAQNADVLVVACRAYAAVGQWEAAEKAANELLVLDPDSVQAHVTFARCAFVKKDFEKTTDLALKAVSLQFATPRAHLLLGKALHEQGDLKEAEHALVNCLKLQIDDYGASEELARVYEKQNQLEKAKMCRANAERLELDAKVKKSQSLRSLRTGIAARAKERHAERKRMREEAAKKAAEEAAIKPMEFTIVSGLPRSGTSLMMQMLQAAGMELMTDGKRQADEDNLEGYWEWMEIKSLKKNPRLIEQAEGKVIKVISALIPQLPPRHRYRIIFMKRPVEEVVASQWKMLERSGQAPKSEKGHLIQTQQTHVEQTLAMLRQRKDVDLIEIDYPSLVADPAEQLPALTDFLGDMVSLPEQLASVIQPALHRNKSQS